MDTVVGKQGTKTVLMVLSERAQRKELIFKIPSKSQVCVVKVLDKLERKMGKLFNNYPRRIFGGLSANMLEQKRITT